MSDELFKRLKSSNRLPSPPGVALRILELSASDDGSLDDIAKVISTDPALAGRLLRFVNSPTAGMARRISTLDEAVNRLGLRGVTLMALSFSLVSSGSEEVCPSFDMEKFWSRSLACAVSAKAFAKIAERIDPNEAFIMGLLLHMGQLALACGAPDLYEGVLQEAAAKPAELLSIEQARLGTTHLVAGARLLEDWKLPEDIWRTILQTRLSPPALTAAGRIPPARILCMADVTASLLCDPLQHCRGAVAEILRLVHESFEMEEASWVEMYDLLVRDWHAYGQMLSVKAGTHKTFRDLQDEAREQMAALSAATELENRGMREQNQQLLQQTRIDALTGVANRTALDERLASELERARRTQRPLVLCMIDIDQFKKFNDSYGHQVGDQVLQTVAKALDDTIRKMDFIARYGGEEFTVIAPECNPSHAASLAERLRQAIADAILEVKGITLKITASVGVGLAQWPDHPKTASELIKAADVQLYAAKRAGRNCCSLESALKQAA